MTTALRLLLVGFVLLLLLAAGAWWYLFGPNAVLAAELVPTNTVALITIPNAANLTVGYETSQLKKLVDAPEAKPIIDTIIEWVGHKNADLISAFLPNLSGQSFIAITHLDPDKPEQTGFIAAMKPKTGTGQFDAFVEKLKATYPEFIKDGTTGTGNVNGVDYQWIKGPGASDKICVAKLSGWIVTTWGESSLGDWIQRLQKKSSSPSLAQNTDYQKSIDRIGHNSMAFVYINSHVLMPAMENLMRRLPTSNAHLEKRLDALGGIALGASFEEGEIMDRFSVLMPRQAQVDAGATGPCAFDTLKFTGPDTQFYCASNINWAQTWKSYQEQSASAPQLGELVSSLQTWTKGAGIDIQHNIVDALGPEVSLQAEWGADTTYPEIGFFAKVNKPDDFKPTIAAIIDTIRKNYGTVAVINEINADDHHYATLKFVQSLPISPTMTEDGDYFGIFLTENQAVRSFKRDSTLGLLHNADFLRQIGDKRNGASQILFLDSPHLLDRGYRTAMPYFSLAAMLNKSVAATLKDRHFPPDLAWLAPMGTWSYVASLNDDGGQGYSVSGIGNQGIYLGAGLGAGAVTLQAMGLVHPPVSAPSTPPSNVTPPLSTSPSPSGSTNAAPQPPSDTMTNSPSDSTPPPTPPNAMTNPPPSAAAPTPDATTSNSDVTPPTSNQPPQTQ
jgi:hypothetical protein